MPIDPAQFTVLVGIYEREIDSLLLNLGKDCKLIFHELITNQNSEIGDPIREDSKRPFYQSPSPIPTSTSSSRIVRALLEHNPADFENFGTKIEHGRDIVQLKTYATDIPDLKRAQYMVPDINVEGIFGARYRLIREPVPQGLKNNRYALSFWERV